MPARRGRGALIVVATLAAVALALRLGFWQLDRAAQKTALQQAWAEREMQPTLSAADLPRQGEGADALHYRSVAVSGRWLGEHTVFLDNRPMDSHAGFYVVTPLALTSGGTVLVERGWVARSLADRTALPPVPATAGTVHVGGFLAPEPSHAFSLGADAPGAVIRQNLDLAEFGREAGLHLLPVVIVERDETPSAVEGDGLLRHWPKPAANVQMHYGYAFQWFAIAAAIALLHVWYRILRPRKRAA